MGTNLHRWCTSNPQPFPDKSTTLCLLHTQSYPVHNHIWVRESRLTIPKGYQGGIQQADNPSLFSFSTQILMIIMINKMYSVAKVFRSHDAPTQLSQQPYLELKLPPPVCSAYSEITLRAQASHVLAISRSDMGSARPRSNMPNFDLAFVDRSSEFLLQPQYTRNQSPPSIHNNI